MFKLNLSLFNVCFIFFLFSVTAYADVYKWVDENGQTHYTQQAPTEQKAELLKTPPPPAFNSADQQRVDELIKQQQADRQANLEQKQQQQQTAEQQAIKQQNCETAKRNLQLYQDNPGRRVVDAEGNVSRLKEEDRQQGISDFQRQVEEFCN